MSKKTLSHLIYFISASLLLLCIAIILWQSQNNFIVETLRLPLNSTNEVYSSNEYTGYIYLTFSGSGQIASNVYSDAFYAFDPQGRMSITEIGRRNYGFEIDNNVADVLTVGNIPVYNSNHAYHDLSYYVGDTPRLISFRVADRDVSDNDGELTITISTNLPSQFRGR